MLLISRRGPSRPALALVLVCAALLSGARAWTAIAAGVPADGVSRWCADHHMHLASVDICERVGDCLPSNDPPAVFGADAVQALDESGVSRGVVFSSAYLYGLASLDLDADAIALWTRRENEFTAAEVAKFPARLTGFLSLDPLQASAFDELHHWRGSQVLTGLKLHLAASAVHMQNEAERRRLADVVRAAAAQQLPIVIHIGGGSFDAPDAELFIQSILGSAGKVPVQIAHAGGGYPFDGGKHARVLNVFADHISKDDPLTRHVWFDLSYVPAPEEDEQAVTDLVREMRRIGIDRFLFGSDYNVLTPADEIGAIGRLGLTDGEQNRLRENCAPWVCMRATGVD